LAFRRHDARFFFFFPRLRHAFFALPMAPPLMRAYAIIFHYACCTPDIRLMLPLHAPPTPAYAYYYAPLSRLLEIESALQQCRRVICRHADCRYAFADSVAAIRRAISLSLMPPLPP